MSWMIHISPHLARIYEQLQIRREDWMTSEEVACEADVARRTANHHLNNLAKEGLVEVAKTFPEFKYRLSTEANSNNPTLTQRLDNSKDLFTK